jgi:hypothetical protein
MGVARPAAVLHEVARPATVLKVARSAMLQRRLQVVVARHAVWRQHLAQHAAVRLWPRLTRQGVLGLTPAQPTLGLFKLKISSSF